MAEIVVKLVNGELAGKTAQSIAKEVNAAALASKKAEIGTKAWIDATQRLAGAKQLQEDYKKQVEATTAASDQLRAAWNKLPGASFFNGIADGFKTAKSGVGGLVSQFGLLKSAIAATGIGLLVIALVTLFDWFKKTDEGATLLGGIFRGLRVIVDKLFAGVRDLGAVLYAAFKNPKQALIDLFEFLKTNAINRLKAFIVIWQAVKEMNLKKLTDGVIQLGTGVENATDKLMGLAKGLADTVKEGIELEAEFDRIEDRARELGVLQAETEKAVSQLLLQSKNVALSYEERIKLLDKASAIEKKNHDEQLKNAKDLEAAVKREVDIAEKNGKVTDDLDQKLKDAIIARINLEKGSIDLQEKIDNRRSALLEKQKAEQEKAAADELKIQQNLEELMLALIEDEQTREIEQIKAETRKKIDALKGSEDQIRRQKELLKIAELQSIARIEQKYADDQAARDAEREKKALEQRMKALNTSFAQENAEILRQYANRELTTNQFHNAILDSRRNNLDAQLKLLEESGQKETDAYSQALAAREQMDIDENQKRKDRRIEMTSTYVNLAQGLANSLVQSQIDSNNREISVLESRLEKIKELNGEESAEYISLSAILESKKRDNFEKNKKLQIKQVDINLAAQLSQIALEAIKLGWPVGLVVGGLLAATAIINAQSNKADIAAQQYEFGGLVEGPSHRQGGVKGIVRSTGQPIEFEGGEFFFSKKATKALGVHNLQRLNNRFTKFEFGGPVNPFRSRPAIPRSVGSNSSAADTATSVIVDRLQSIEESLSKWPTRIKVINVVSETSDGIKALNQIQSNADV